MKFLYEYLSKETAYVVTDYPWGFRLRTTIRYWIETKPSHGQRYASQTAHPKTGAWCAPKYSTYYDIVLMYLDEKKHVKFTAIGGYDTDERLAEFKEKHYQEFSDYQKKMLDKLIKINAMMKKVKIEFKAVNYDI